MFIYRPREELRTKVRGVTELTTSLSSIGFLFHTYSKEI